MKKMIISLLLLSTKTFGFTSFNNCLRTIPKCAHLIAEETEEIKIQNNTKTLQSYMESKEQAARFKCIKENSIPENVNCKTSVVHYNFHIKCKSEILKNCVTEKPGHGNILSCVRTLIKKSKSCKDFYNHDEIKEYPPPLTGHGAC